MGIGTQAFLPRISETNARILDQSKMNQPLRVAIPAGSPDKRGNLHAR
jgi:hypothetical protein